MKIVVVDDQVRFRESLVSMLQSQADMMVAGEAGSVREAVEKSLNCEPDLVLLDMILPGSRTSQSDFIRFLPE